MNKTEQRVYLTPEVEVVEFAVEQGFDGSLGNQIEDLGGEKIEGDWE
ncbi:MAG: hypothetical protein J6K81_01980 [Rikenellaceae bacterium]|nr:hypothetical protein [Rikenellaceae bacterium]